MSTIRELAIVDHEAARASDQDANIMPVCLEHFLARQYGIDNNVGTLLAFHDPDEPLPSALDYTRRRSKWNRRAWFHGMKTLREGHIPFNDGRLRSSVGKQTVSTPFEGIYTKFLKNLVAKLTDDFTDADETIALSEIADAAKVPIETLLANIIGVHWRNAPGDFDVTWVNPDGSTADSKKPYPHWMAALRSFEKKHTIDADSVFNAETTGQLNEDGTATVKIGARRHPQRMITEWFDPSPGIQETYDLKSQEYGSRYSWTGGEIIRDVDDSIPRSKERKRRLALIRKKDRTITHLAEVNNDAKCGRYLTPAEFEIAVLSGAFDNVNPVTDVEMPDVDPEYVNWSWDDSPFNPEGQLTPEEIIDSRNRTTDWRYCRHVEHMDPDAAELYNWIAYGTVGAKNRYKELWIDNGGVPMTIKIKEEIYRIPVISFPWAEDALDGLTCHEAGDPARPFEDPFFRGVWSTLKDFQTPLAFRIHPNTQDLIDRCQPRENDDPVPMTAKQMRRHRIQTLHQRAIRLKLTHDIEALARKFRDRSFDPNAELLTPNPTKHRTMKVPNSPELPPVDPQPKAGRIIAARDRKTLGMIVILEVIKPDPQGDIYRRQGPSPWQEG